MSKCLIFSYSAFGIKLNEILIFSPIPPFLTLYSINYIVIPEFLEIHNAGFICLLDVYAANVAFRTAFMNVWKFHLLQNLNDKCLHF